MREQTESIRSREKEVEKRQRESESKREINERALSFFITSFITSGWLLIPCRAAP